MKEENLGFAFEQRTIQIVESTKKIFAREKFTVLSVDERSFVVSSALAVAHHCNNHRIRIVVVLAFREQLQLVVHFLVHGEIVLKKLKLFVLFETYYNPSQIRFDDDFVAKLLQQLI